MAVITIKFGFESQQKKHIYGNKFVYCYIFIIDVEKQYYYISH